MVIKILFRILGLLVSLCDLIVPKRRNAFVFVVGANNTFAGNIKATHDYFIKQISVSVSLLVNVTSDLSLCEEQYRNKIIFVNTAEGLWILLRSQNIIIEYWSGDWIWPGILQNRHTITNLWHGIPIKKIGIAQHATRSMRVESKKTKYFIASSHIDQAMMSACFGVDYNNVLLTGYPRNDWLISDHYLLLSPSLTAIKDAILSKMSGKKLILYAPTYRGDHTVKNDNFNGIYRFSDNDLRKIKNTLRDHNAILGIRPHINKLTDTRFQYDDLIVDLSRNVIPDAQILLRYTDVLISDYSGIWVDYLLLDKPIIGFIYDWEHYLQDRGYLYDYLKIFPGSLVKTFDELMETLDESLHQSHRGEITEKQKIIKGLFHAHIDGNSSERLYKKLIAD